MAGLASLTANYTDSEDEDDKSGEATEPWVSSSAPPPEAALIGLVERLKERSTTPASLGGGGGSTSASAKSTPSKKMRLVSYAEEGDNDPPSDDGDVVPMDLDSDNDGVEGGDSAARREETEKAEDTEERAEMQNAIKVEAWTGGVKLPPEPTGLCDPKLQERINHLFKRKVESKYDINAVIQNKKAFRNPSIYEKLIQFCDIDETGTNFPKELYDGHLFGRESHYDELAKVQALDMEKREKSAKARGLRAEVPIVPTVSSIKKVEDISIGGKRKSKWDQAGPPPAPVSTTSRPPTNPNLPAPCVPAPQVVSANATAAKTISAFGPLKK